jgi:(2Fe-2S) ferredoxin
MGKLNLEQLKQIREIVKNSNKNEILVSLGTCGIAAGGDKIYEILKQEIKDRDLENVIIVKKTGCLGLCFCEPNLVINTPGLPETVYGYVTEDIAYKIITEHVMKKNIIDENVIFIPSNDLISFKEEK